MAAIWGQEARAAGEAIRRGNLSSVGECAPGGCSGWLQGADEAPGEWVKLRRVAQGVAAALVLVTR